jgi:hypothetical protein
MNPQMLTMMTIRRNKNTRMMNIPRKNRLTILKKKRNQVHKNRKRKLTRRLLLLKKKKTKEKAKKISPLHQSDWSDKPCIILIIQLIK